MKYIYASLLFSLLFIGCGYKTSPIYIDGSKKEIKTIK
jgi:hypothetical protein